MLWSLLKIVIFICLIGALAFGAGFLMETDGGVQISVAGTEYTLGALESVVALIVLTIGLWVLLRIVGLFVAFIRFLTGDETAVSRYFNRNKERRGYDALAEGMMALASGESQLALTKAAKAERLLQKPELTTLLMAQAAEQTGDRAKAEVAYKHLLKNERTRFVGVRGLMKQKLAEGETDVALRLAEKAFGLKPGHGDTQDVLLKLQAGTHDWAGARNTLGAKLKHGALPRDVYKRRDAVLALGQARDILDEDKDIAAREAAIEANRLSPDLIPAAVMASDGYVADGKPKNATKVIRKAWDVAPHPDLAAAFARIKPEESAKDRIHRFTVLTNRHPDLPETRMLKAELWIAAENFVEAKKALGSLAEEEPTARSLTIMAAIERGMGSDDAVVKSWLARALSAPRGPQWVCDNCKRAHSDWSPVCESCESFDTLSWRQPEDDTAPLPANAAMLPLIVGQAEEVEVLEDASDDSDEADDTISEPEVFEAVKEAKESPAPETADTANADAPPVDYVLGSGEAKKDAT